MSASYDPPPVIAADDRSEMDERLFGSSEMGDSAFRLCVALFEALLDEVTQAFPDQVRPLIRALLS